MLLRPIHPIHEDLAVLAGWKAVVIVLWLPIAAFLTLIFHPTLAPPVEIAVFFVAIWGAYVMRSLELWMLGLVTFWTTRVGPVFDIFFTAELLLSGRLVPLSLMPEWAQNLAGVLPFQWTFGFPIEALDRPAPGDELLAGLGIQVLWIGQRDGRRMSAGGWRSGDSPRWAAEWHREPLRPLRLFGLYFRVGAMNELQYRANLAIQLFQSVMALVTGLIVLGLVFGQTTNLGGWSQAELLAVMGVHILMGGIIGTAIQPNMERLMTDVRQGTLDFILTKPEDAQVLVSVREFRIWQSSTSSSAAVVLGVALVQIQGGIGSGTRWCSRSPCCSAR